ncbi:MAG: hypothetical protein KF713_00050 [Turneriella sp.]|nr:hypothetical protein [Turneriella sp.]
MNNSIISVFIDTNIIPKDSTSGGHNGDLARRLIDFCRSKAIDVRSPNGTLYDIFRNSEGPKVNSARERAKMRRSIAPIEVEEEISLSYFTPDRVRLYQILQPAFDPSTAAYDHYRSLPENSQSDFHNLAAAYDASWNRLTYFVAFDQDIVAPERIASIEQVARDNNKHLRIRRLSEEFLGEIRSEIEAATNAELHLLQ